MEKILLFFLFLSYMLYHLIETLLSLSGLRPSHTSRENFWTSSKYAKYQELFQIFIYLNPLVLTNLVLI
jgi:hypothetical protein